MVRTMLMTFGVFALMMAAVPAMAQTQGKAAPSPLGLWLTENGRSVIEVRPCKNDTALVCGRIHWIIDGGMKFDEKNPDIAQRANPMCGLQILTGFKLQDGANWIDGKIYKADEGDIYNATIQMLPTGKMLVRGYIGMPLFGRSQTWTRVTGVEHKKCTSARG